MYQAPRDFGMCITHERRFFLVHRFNMQFLDCHADASHFDGTGKAMRTCTDKNPRIDTAHQLPLENACLNCLTVLFVQL